MTSRTQARNPGHPELMATPQAIQKLMFSQCPVYVHQMWSCILQTVSLRMRSVITYIRCTGEDIMLLAGLATGWGSGYGWLYSHRFSLYDSFHRYSTVYCITKLRKTHSRYLYFFKKFSWIVILDFFMCYECHKVDFLNLRINVYTCFLSFCGTCALMDQSVNPTQASTSQHHPGGLVLTQYPGQYIPASSRLVGPNPIPRPVHPSITQVGWS